MTRAVGNVSSGVCLRIEELISDTEKDPVRQWDRLADRFASVRIGAVHREDTLL